MVLLGLSTSQLLFIVSAAISLLILMALLWMNHRTLVVARPLAVPIQTGVLCPVQSVSRQVGCYTPALPARAPPTFPAPSFSMLLDATDPDFYLMGRSTVCDSAEKFR